MPENHSFSDVKGSPMNDALLPASNSSRIVLPQGVQLIRVGSPHTTPGSKSSLHRPITIGSASLVKVNSCVNCAQKLCSWKMVAIHNPSFFEACPQRVHRALQRRTCVGK
ncbi:hypothetical protein ABBQ32_008844 [Trebouxia sp. C0010 RCD-2024]